MKQILSEIDAAAHRLYPHVRKTWLEYSPHFSALTGAKVWLKLENLQRTGSFKVRGAFNKLLSLEAHELARGCVTASSGNHGAASAYAMAKLGVKGLIFVPQTTSSSKLAAIHRYGGEVRLFGRESGESEGEARRYAAENGMTYISPYNDLAVLAGQGTCGVEMADQLDAIDAVFVSVGGGGLIGGIGAYLKSRDSDIEVVGCLPENSPAMARALEAGRIIECEHLPTLSDGTAGSIEEGAITFPVCQAVIDNVALVDEASIVAAMRDFIDGENMLLEGSAGVALAGLKARAKSLAGKNVVVVICGANISRDTLRDVL
ncbi:MAG: threonine/serine dehydratase [Woeseiaceae bacterium]